MQFYAKMSTEIAPCHLISRNTASASPLIPPQCKHVHLVSGNLPNRHRYKKINSCIEVALARNQSHDCSKSSQDFPLTIMSLLQALWTVLFNLFSFTLSTLLPPCSPFNTHNTYCNIPLLGFQLTFLFPYYFYFPITELNFHIDLN